MFLKLDRRGALHEQVYRALRLEILRSRMRPGARVPSTRWLASEIGVSRNVVALAYSHLLAEGYLSTRRGAGTYVAAELPEITISCGQSAIKSASPPRRPARLSSYALHIEQEWKHGLSWAPGAARLRYDFRYGPPSLAEFPYETWCRILARCARRASNRDLDYGPPEGSQALREALCDYLRSARAIQCHPEQILIVSGIKQGLDIATRVLIESGDCVALEDPQMRTVRAVFRAAGAKLTAVPVDAQGIAIERLRPTRQVRLMHLTPSYQFPTGITMSLARRLEVLAWAKRAGTVIFEDDYDSGYRYSGPSVEALHALDDSQSVIYAGTFSKSLFPALRLGYLVLPEYLVSIFRSTKALIDTGSPMLPQLAVAHFLREGHFERHLRKLRTRNAQRRAALVDALDRHLGERVQVSGSNAGDHILVWLRDFSFARASEVCRRAGAAGVRVYSVRPFYVAPPTRAGLLLGYASMNEREIREGILRLAQVLA
jgi:GntR family transcriptional regulator/MocR family aminotransferase